jgi:hypothetical protein
MLDRTRANRRLRRHRARRRKGRQLYRIEQDEVVIEAMLEAEGLLLWIRRSVVRVHPAVQGKILESLPQFSWHSHSPSKHS